MTDGQKATIIREAARNFLADDLVTRSRESRDALRTILELPAVSLALFFDAIEAAKGGAK